MCELPNCQIYFSAKFSGYMVYLETKCTNCPNFCPTEPFLDGGCNFDLLTFTVYCNTSLDATQVPLTYTCSYDGGPEEICTLQ